MFLPARQPYDGAALLGFLAARAIPGVEEVRDGTYRRTLDLARGGAVVAVTPEAAGVRVALDLDDARDEAEALARCGALFGLDADPVAPAAVLGADRALAPLVARRPGLRVPGAAGGWEVAVRAVLGQQISVGAARALAGRIVARLGTPLARPDGALSHRFPTPANLADARDDALPMPRSRARALRALATAHPALAGPGDAEALLELPGIGPWTAGYVALRLGDPDVFLPGDVAVRRALAQHGLTAADSERWRPWRSLAVVHLWASLSGDPPGAASIRGV